MLINKIIEYKHTKRFDSLLEEYCKFHQITKEFALAELEIYEQESQDDPYWSGDERD